MWSLLVYSHMSILTQRQVQPNPFKSTMRYQHQKRNQWNKKRTGKLEINKGHFIDPINRLAYKSELMS